MARSSLPADLTRVVLIGLGRIGGRAVASAAKSVMKDGRRIARQAEQRLQDASDRIDDMTGGHDEPHERHRRGDE